MMLDDLAELSAERGIEAAFGLGIAIIGAIPAAIGAIIFRARYRYLCPLCKAKLSRKSKSCPACRAPLKAN